MPDDKVLLAAASGDRILVTHDRRTMPEHFGKFIQHHHCPGVLLVLQSLSVNDAIEELLLVWSASTQEEWANRIVYLPL